MEDKKMVNLDIYPIEGSGTCLQIPQERNMTQ
jgi:hypothetical protein